VGSNPTGPTLSSKALVHVFEPPVTMPRPQCQIAALTPADDQFRDVRENYLERSEEAGIGPVAHKCARAARSAVVRDGSR
jgi:hypothetical protein